MTLQIKNTQYFEWKVPDGLLSKSNYTEDDLQQLIDEYFIPDDILVGQISDDYYELEGFTND